MKLILNADDFGHSKGVNLGIIEAYQNGVVRSTTIMSGMPGFDHAVTLAKQNPGLKIGAHLTLTCGRSVGGVYKTITDKNGNFLKLNQLTEMVKQIDMSEVEREYEAQIQKILASGIEVDHFDSHHHTHNLAGVFDVFLKLAVKHNKAVRVYDKSVLRGEFAGLKAPDCFIDTFFDESATSRHLISIIDTVSNSRSGKFRPTAPTPAEFSLDCLNWKQYEQNKCESLEIMCHPAYLDQTLLNSSSYNIQRTAELSVLTGNIIKRYIDTNNIQLASFSDL